MICKECNNEFDEKNFTVCPFCLATFDNEKSNQIANDAIGGNSLPNIFIDDLKNISTRTKNVLTRNQIRTIGDLIIFLEVNKVSDLRGAGAKVVDEILDIVAQVKYDYPDNDYAKTIEEKVIDAINNNTQPNVKLDQIYDLSTRSYNVLKKNDATDMLTIAEFLHANRLSDIRGAGANFAEEMPKILDNFLSGIYPKPTPKVNIIELLKTELQNNINSRSFNIVLRRALGETLLEIAQNPLDQQGDSITRERVRQIEASFYKKYVKKLEAVVESNWGERKYFNAQDLRDLFDNDDIGMVAVATLATSQKYTYLDFADCFINNEKYGNNVERKVLSLISDYIGDGIDLDQNMDNISELLITNGIDFIGTYELVNLLNKYKFKFYKDFVTKTRTPYAVLCKKIILEKFPYGIKLSAVDNGQSEDLTILRKIAKERYGDIGIPENNRAFSARLSSVLVICDRGKAIPEESIQIDFSILQNIKNFIDDYEVEKIYYSELFAHFEGVLKLTSNVDNHHFLHGVLMLYFPTEYNYCKDYLIRNHVPRDSTNLAERINKYIHELGRPISKAEIKKRFPGFTDAMFLAQINSNPLIMQWGLDSYNTLELISCNSDDILNLDYYISTSLKKYGGFISDNILFEEVSANMNDFLKRNGLSPINLFYLCAKIFENNYAFRYPNIGKKDILEYPTIKDISLYLLGYPQKLSYKSFTNLTDKMKWSQVSAFSAFYAIEDKYYRISDDEYLAKDSFLIKEKDLKSIKTYLFSLLSQKEYISLLVFTDFPNLPNLNYEWNTFLLESIIKKYIPELKLISPDNKDRRYQKTIIIAAEQQIDSYAELIAYIFRKNGYTELSESKFLSFLVINGLSLKLIPKEISNSRYFTVEDGIYKLYPNS